MLSRIRLLGAFNHSFSFSACDWFSSVQSLSRVRLFATPWTAARQGSLSTTNSRSSPKLMSIESVMLSTISSSVGPFSSCPQSLPASEYFLMSQFFTWGGQSIGVSALASVLPKNTQDWSPLEWTGWISLQAEYSWVFYFFFLTHSVTLCLLIGEFNPFTYKRIMNW